MSDNNPSSLLVLKLGVFIAIVTCIELAVTRKLLKSHEQDVLPPDIIQDILTLINNDSYELLTDVSQIARQLAKSAAAEGGRELTQSELATVVLTDSLQEKLLQIKESAIDAHNLKCDLDKFYRCAHQCIEDDKIRGLLDGYEMMLQDAISGTLPLLPYYIPDPSPSQEEILKVLCEIQSGQTKQILLILEQLIKDEGVKACSAWLSIENNRFDASQAPSHIAARLRAAVRAVENDVIEKSAAVVGDRRNFLYLVASAHRDPQFEQSWIIARELAEGNLIEGIQRLMQTNEQNLLETPN